MVAGHLNGIPIDVGRLRACLEAYPVRILVLVKYLRISEIQIEFDITIESAAVLELPNSYCNYPTTTIRIFTLHVLK